MTAALNILFNYKANILYFCMSFFYLVKFNCIQSESCSFLYRSFVIRTVYLI